MLRSVRILSRSRRGFMTRRTGSLVSVGFSLFLLNSSVVAENSEPTTGKSDARLTIEEQYVRENLEEFLHPTSLEFLPDGRAKLVFDLTKKDSAHEQVFLPQIKSDLKSRLRWTVRREEQRYYFRADTRYSKGLRISDKSFAMLNCWFEDDLEAEVVYVNNTSFAASQVAAVVFCNQKGDAVGSNYGSQCTTFRKGKPTRKRKGKPRAMNIYSDAEFKLVVRDGSFESHLKGRKTETMKYSEKSFASGRVGFICAGNASGMIPRIVITGRIDAKKMAKLMRKKR